MIPYGRQDISDADIAAVVEVLKSEYITQGPRVNLFEKQLAEYCGARFGTAVNSATSALQLACLALDIGPGDTVWTSPITFVATANAVLMTGAGIDFVDIDKLTGNISVEALSEKLERAEKRGRSPKAVIPVHLGGQSCDMAEIAKLAARYEFKVLEDASHALGGRYGDMPIGGCQHSDAAVFSFHPVKMITTGEGGMIMCNDSELAQRVNCLRSHGVTRNVHEMNRSVDGPWFYQQLELGFNYRMNDFAAALGSSQLQRLDEFVALRTQIADRYDEQLDLDMVKPLARASFAQSSFHLYIVRVVEKAEHRMLFERLIASGIKVNLHYIPVYRHPYYVSMGFDPEQFPQAEDYYRRAVSLPVYPRLQQSEQCKVIEVLRTALGAQTLF